MAYKNRVGCGGGQPPLFAPRFCKYVEAVWLRGQDLFKTLRLEIGFEIATLTAREPVLCFGNQTKLPKDTNS
jgi:hypothetical protein